MASANGLADDLKYDIERIPLPGAEKASDGALEILDEIGDGRVTVERVAAYGRCEVPKDGVKYTDLLRVLQHAEGRLALVTWSNAGMTAIGFRPGEQRYDVGGYSAVRERMGHEPEYHDVCSRAKAKDMILTRTPDVVRRDEVELLDALDSRGEQS